jgi:cell division protein FtsB
MDVQIVIATLQRKVSELTLTNVMLEAQLQDLRSQLNSMKEQQSIENAIDGNENQAQEINNGSGSTDDF